MRIPTLILEHPIEAAIASLLLLGLLFSSADFTGAKTPAQSPASAAQKF